jgi:hypothetical protein
MEGAKCEVDVLERTIRSRSADRKHGGLVRDGGRESTMTIDEAEIGLLSFKLRLFSGLTDAKSFV